MMKSMREDVTDVSITLAKGESSTDSGSHPGGNPFEGGPFDDLFRNQYRSKPQGTPPRRGRSGIGSGVLVHKSGNTRPSSWRSNWHRLWVRHATWRDILKQILTDNSNVLEDPLPQGAFERFGDRSLNFIVKAHLAFMDMATRLETIHELNTAINECFAEEGIEIPFPQRALHLRSVDPSAQLAGVAARER